MAKWDILKQAVTSAISTNGNQEITGSVLQSTLLNIINSLGENATFEGVANPGFNPGTPDGPVFYIAAASGEYANFGTLTVDTSNRGAAVLYWNGESWSILYTGLAILDSTEEKILELKSQVLAKKIGGIAFSATPNKREENTVYRNDGTTTTVNGFSSETYIFEVGTSVRINIERDFPSANLSVIAYRNGAGIFKPILSSPLTVSNQYEVNITITNEMKELIVVGCKLNVIDPQYELYTEGFYEEKKPAYVDSQNTEIASTGFNLYYFNVEGVEKIKIFFASGGGRALFVDDNNNVVGTPFQSEPVGQDYFVSTWKDVEVPAGSTILKLSQVKRTSSYPLVYPCKILMYKYSTEAFVDRFKFAERGAELLDLIYDSKTDGYVNAENVENTSNKGFYLYKFDVKNSTRVRLYFASGGGRALFVDDNNNVVGTPFQSEPVGQDYYVSTWKDVEVPAGSTILKLSQVKRTSSYPNIYPCRVLGDRHNYDELKAAKTSINKTLVNVGMSIWWQDGNTISPSNNIDSQGGVNKGYQSWLNEIFNFPSIVKYSYSGFSLGIGDDPSQSIMNTKASSWVAQNNAIWTLDTITNDFGRKVSLGEPSDFENNTGISTFYGALRAFKEKVAELSPNAIVVCSNALYRTAKQNGLGLTLEDYEKAMCYAAAKCGWYFVDQYRTSINETNAHVALYDGLHPTNFGFKLAVKPWIEQFRILQATI